MLHSLPAVSWGRLRHRDPLPYVDNHVLSLNAAFDSSLLRVVTPPPEQAWRLHLEVADPLPECACVCVCVCVPDNILPLCVQDEWSFTWTKAQNMPVKTAAAQAVVLNGKVYVAIGKADDEEDQMIIQVYTTKSQKWSQLLESPMRFSAMAVVDQQLVLVAYDELLAWDGHWTFPYPSLPTPREDPVAIGYQHFLIVAAGRNKKSSSLKGVDILNSSSKQWSTASPLPVGCHGLTSAVVGDTLYLLGGWTGYEPNQQVFSTSLPALVSQATVNPTAPPPTWDLATEMLLKHCTGTSVRSSLLVVGGEDEEYVHSSAISRYDPQLKQWTKVGEMPEAQSQCACVVLPSGELMVIGGTCSNLHRSDRVYLANISN